MVKWKGQQPRSQEAEVQATVSCGSLGRLETQFPHSMNFSHFLWSVKWNSKVGAFLKFCSAEIYARQLFHTALKPQKQNIPTQPHQWFKSEVLKYVGI